MSGIEDKREMDWCQLYRREVRAHTEEMVRNAGLAEQNSELLHALAQLIANPEDEDARALAEDVISSQ